MAKTLSMTTLPPSMVAACRPSMVTSGSSALRATWRSTMRRRGKPLGARGEHEVLRQTSAMPARIMRRIEREIDEAERGDRQHEVPGDVERAVEARPCPRRWSRCRDVGNQRSCTAKTTLSTRPSQKPGTA